MGVGTGSDRLEAGTGHHAGAVHRAGGERDRPEALLGLHFGQGEVLVLTAVLAWSFYTSLLKLRPEIHPLSFLFTTFVIAAMAMGTFWNLVVVRTRALTAAYVCHLLWDVTILYLIPY